MKILLSKKEAGMPMYLSLACEELRVFGVYEKVSFSLLPGPVMTTHRLVSVLHNLCLILYFDV